MEYNNIFNLLFIILKDKNIDLVKHKTAFTHTRKGFIMFTDYFKSIPLSSAQTPQVRKRNYKLSIRNIWLRALAIILGVVIILTITKYDIIRDSIGAFLFSLVFVTFALVLLSLMDCHRLRKSYKKLEKMSLNKQDTPQPKKTINQVFNQYLEKSAVDDPLVYAKVGAQEIWYVITSVLKEPDGRINVNNVLLWTSGLSGIACQASIWEKALQTGTTTELIVIGTTSGRKFYIGNALNKFLLESQYSIWNLAAGTYRQFMPSKPLPDLEELVKQSVNMIGNEEYRIWGEVDPYNMVIEYTKVWKSLESKIKFLCNNPDHWPLMFGLVLQKALEMVNQVLPEDKNCLEMAMENVLFTAKLDIKDLLWTTPLT